MKGKEEKQTSNANLFFYALWKQGLKQLFSLDETMWEMNLFARMNAKDQPSAMQPQTGETHGKIPYFAFF